MCTSNAHTFTELRSCQILWNGISHLMWVWYLNAGPLNAQQVLLMSEPSSNPCLANGLVLIGHRVVLGVFIYLMN